MYKAQSKKNGNRGLLIVVIVLLLAVIGLLAALLFKSSGDGQAQSSTTKKRDASAAVGQIKGKTPEEIQAALNKTVEAGMFNISINSQIVFPSGTTEGDVRIENIAANRQLMRVVITRDDTGEQVYETEIIEPGYHIQNDTLDVPLPKGVYPCTALFTAYDPDTEAVLGQVAAKVTVTVEN